MFLVIIPFSFFLFLTILIYRRRGCDISFMMAIIYLISSLCAIMLYSNSESSYKDFQKYPLGIIPTVLFCCIPLLFIIPFFNYNSNKVRNVEILANTKLFDRICYLYIALFFINIFVYWSLVQNALTSDLGELRKEVYLGEGIDLTKGMSLPMKVLFYIPTTLGGGSLFMLIFFFYSVTFLNKGKVFNILLFVSTLSSIYAGIATATRTTVFYWLLLFFFCFLLFRRYMKKKTVRSLYLILFIFGSLMIVYFMAVSISRFSEFTGGTQGGFLGYIGQPYLEYNNLWEAVPSQFRSLKNIFPWGNMFLWHHTSGVEQASEVMGYPINGFNTIMGIFLVDLGKTISVLVTLAFCFVIRTFVNKEVKKRFSLSSSIVVLLFAIIPLTGIVNYYYYSTETVFAFFFFLYLSRQFKKQPHRIVAI